MRSLAILVLALLAAPARAAEIGAGHWEMDIVTTMPGMPAGGMPIKQVQCLSAEDGKDPAKLFGSPGSGCRFTDQRDTGSAYHFRISCSAPTAVSGAGEMRYTRDTLDGQIVLDMKQQGGQSVQTKTTIKARRTGPCATPR